MSQAGRLSGVGLDQRARNPRTFEVRRATVRVLVLIIALLFGTSAILRPDRAIRIATGGTAHALCAGVFVSGRDANRTYEEETRPEPGMALLDWGSRYRVDPRAREVSVTFAGMFESRVAFRGDTGCLDVHGEVPAVSPGRDLGAMALPRDVGSFVEATTRDERVRAAVDEGFAEPEPTRRRNTKAVVVVHRGRIIAERYAEGIKVDTPLSGHSLSKSVTHALIGLLVHEGKLSEGAPAPVPEWSRPSDPRREITVDELLRMSSGLPWDERIPGFDAATRMWFIERDMYAFAVRAPIEGAPGTRWNYSNRGYMVLCRLVRDGVGGTDEDVLRFARRDLFLPVGMKNTLIDFDATGTPICTSDVYASARDWARFGLLYLNGGVVDGRRVLPEEWVRAASAKTLDTGYGAGFWINSVHTPQPLLGTWGMEGAPADAFYGRGHLGQYVVIIPSRQLVVVRLGSSHLPHDDIVGVGHMVKKIVSAIDDGT